MQSNYNYEFVILRDGGSPVARLPMSADWRYVLECLHFDAARRGQRPPLLISGSSLRNWTATPNFRPGSKVYVESFTITLNSESSDRDDPPVSTTVPTAYLSTAAEQQAVRLVEQGQLVPGEAFRYLVAAQPVNLLAPAALPAPGASTFDVEEIVEPLPCDNVPLKPFLDRSKPTTMHNAGEHPVFVPRHVVSEAVGLAQAAGDAETGGFLIGYLHCDPVVPEIFVEITAQLPAQHTEANSAKVTFTPDTWVAVESEIRARRRNELLLGHWHAHPDFCRIKGCRFEKRLECTAARPFFSQDDVLLHSQCFSRPYLTGLLVSDSTRDGWTTTLFGWRGGMVAPRGYHLLSERPTRKD